MKLHLVGLAALFSALSAMLYDVQSLALPYSTLKFSGPALALGTASFFVMAAVLITIQRLSERLEHMAHDQLKSVEPRFSDRQPHSVRALIDVPQADPAPKAIAATVNETPLIPFPMKLPRVDLSQCDLRAERRVS